ncbi:MAG: redoxin family protein [Tepidisphaeraceae bacterium]
MTRLPLALLAFSIVSMALLAHPTTAAALGVGDPAPKLAQGKYVQGDPVSEFEKGKVYVVEMWATWCGPCVSAIPHINDLQKKYADKGLIVIGQNVWEHDEAKVEPFIKEMGEKMTYRVAMDDVSAGANAGTMATTWMKAANRNGIPCSFIVNQEGVIAWIGHPMQMDEPLAKVIEKKLDIAAAKAEFEGQQKVESVMQEVSGLARAGKWDQVLAKLDEAEKASPASVKMLAPMRYQALVETKQPDKAAAIAEEALKNAKEQPIPALMIAQGALAAKEYDTALKLATAGAEHVGEQKPMAQALVASIHAAKKDWAKAVEVQKQAINGAPERVKPHLEKQLKEYEANAAKAPA